MFNVGCSYLAKMAQTLLVFFTSKAIVQVWDDHVEGVEVVVDWVGNLCVYTYETVETRAALELL